MSKSGSKKNNTKFEYEPKITTPHILNSKRKESRVRLNRMKAKRRRGREFNSGKLVSVLLAAALIFFLVLMVWLALHKNAQAVKIDNEQFAYIKDMNTSTEEFNKLVLAKLKEKTGNNVQLKQTVTLVPVHVSRKKVDANTENVLTKLCDKLTYKQEAAVITVNGEEKAVLSSEDEANSLLKQIVEIYEPEDKASVKESGFVDDVKVQSKFVDDDEVMTTVKASDVLRSTTTEKKKYTVVSGDTFGYIAQKAQMTEEELLKENPSFTKDTISKLKIGQELNITVPVPVVSVRVVREVKETSGNKEITVRITSVNGMEQSREKVSEKVIG